MVSRRKSSPRMPSKPKWHPTFMGMLPKICRYARHAFRHLSPECREESVQDVVCNALVAFSRLADHGKIELAYPTVLARYGIVQHRCGRRVGTRLNILDITSPYCRANKGVVVGRLDRYDANEEAWREILIEDRHAGPAEIATSRIDFAGWLKTLSRRDRKLALKLATGENTGKVAKLFKVSAGRISQIRRELMESWRTFVGEEPMPDAA